MTIIGLIIGGALFGIAAGVLIAPLKVGCTALLIVPVAMIGYVSLWQSLHTNLLRSTSALDYLFGPLWPSLGALAGFGIGGVVRGIVIRRRRHVR